MYAALTGVSRDRFRTLSFPWLSKILLRRFELKIILGTSGRIINKPNVLVKT